MPEDNAWVESFFATRKKECIYFRQFATRDEQRQAVCEWIEGFCNTKRLEYCSAMEYAKLPTKEKVE